MADGPSDAARHPRWLTRSSEHAEATFKHGANIYLASVAETEQGTRGSHVRLPEIAKKFDAPVVMVNCVGTCDGVYCAGKSAVWNPAGEQLVQLDDSSEGLIIFDTDRQEAVAIEVSSPSCAAPP